MPILGPDGQPISSGGSTPPDSAEAEQVRQIVEHSKLVAQQGDPRSALMQMVYAFQNDVSSDLVVDTTIEILEQLRELTGQEQNTELVLFQNLRHHRDDPAAYQQLGHWFGSNQQFFIARPFLARAKELLGDQKSELSQVVDMFMAQTYLSLGAYEDATNAYHSLNDNYGSLPPWLLMELAECYALLRQVDAAEAVYQVAPPEVFDQFPEYPQMPMIHEEVGDLIARVRDFEDVEEMELCDWHYVQTRGILIEMNPNPDLNMSQEAPDQEGEEAEKYSSGRFVYFVPSEEDIAHIVAISAAFLDQKELTPDRIVWLGANSEPLARIFAEWWEISEENLREYRHGDNSEEAEPLTLMVMAHSFDLQTNLPAGVEDVDKKEPQELLQLAEEQFADLVEARAGLITFALDLHWTEKQLMTPDIAGFMTQQCSLPWETRFELNEVTQTVTEVKDSRTPQEIAKDIAKRFPDEEKCDDIAKELIEDYSICTDLILDHRDGTLVRRPLLQHSPVRTPRVGF